MRFTVDVWTDGACRKNGYPDAVGGAGVWFPHLPEGCRSEPLPSSPTPTNQRAELTAIILALEEGLRLQSALQPTQWPFFVLNVGTDSQYAVNCLTVWLGNWKRNGWMTTSNQPVLNADLIKRADDLREELEHKFLGGEVNFSWVPREQNAEADRLANKGCDEAERLQRGNTAHLNTYFVGFTTV
ncbi:ribonuclease H-like domain-containing protein [Mycena filopes]|nr:ribonuclease H-like domain-containing protein [Mycena filopes]